jgi:hypothetical protein
VIHPRECSQGAHQAHQPRRPRYLDERSLLHGISQKKRPTPFKCRTPLSVLPQLLIRNLYAMRHLLINKDFSHPRAHYCGASITSCATSASFSLRSIAVFRSSA